MNRNAKNIAITLVIALVLSGCCSPIIISGGAEAAGENHPQPGIWEYTNSLNHPETPLVLTLERQQWQAAAAACMTPVFTGRMHNIPLLFDDGSEEREISIPHETKAVSDFGNNAQSATASIASTYWTAAEIVVSAGTYEEVLWAVPVASFLSSPILVSPSPAILNSLGTRCVVAVGEIHAPAGESIHLPTKEDVWRFQVELFDTKGRESNYIVATNPHDTEENDEVKWGFLSLASAPIAAYRGALVQTGNYTGDRAAIDSIARASKSLDDAYKVIRPSFEKVKNDTYSAAVFLSELGHVPEFLALVGGSYALPDYYFDYHVSYFYWGATLDYVASTAPYGNLTYNLTYEAYPREDMGVGRIMGHSLLDCTTLLSRTFSYREFLPGGEFAHLAPEAWENRSSVIEGHRINQPNFGGPPVPPTAPYKPAGEVDDIFRDAGFNETYLLPRNITVMTDLNRPIGEILDNASSSSVALINAHGGVSGEQALIEIGIDPVLGKEYTFILDESEATKRQYPPSLVYVIACETGTTAIDIPMEDYLALGYLHSGAVAYIAPDTYQTICFWDQAPEGPEADQTIFFFHSLLSEDIAVGTALSRAKWEASRIWINESTFQDDVAGATVHLYGDPAFKPYRPQAPFVDRSRFDVSVSFDGAIKSGSRFGVSVGLTDTVTHKKVDDAQVRITFQKRSVNSNTARFDTPGEDGTYILEITVGKVGYAGQKVRYRIQVPGGGEDVYPILLAGSGVAIIAILVVVSKKRRAAPKTFTADVQGDEGEQGEPPSGADIKDNDGG